MFKNSIVAISAVVCATACASAQAPGSDERETPGWLEKDFAEMVSLFEGQWDTDRHVFFAEQAGMDAGKIAPQQHLKIDRAPIDDDSENPAMARFFAERTVAGEPPARLAHTFSIDANLKAIRQSMAIPNEDGSVRGLGCEVLWNRHGAQFEGRASGQGCDALFPRPLSDAPLDVSFALSETEYWVTAKRGEDIVEARFRRARLFECWTAILRGAEHGDSGEGLRDWDFRRGVTLHDQGGVAELITDEDPPRKVRLRLRNVDWPYGTNRPSLTLYVLEGDNDRAVSYAWNEGNAERIGINLRWLQASCTYAPDNVAE